MTIGKQLHQSATHREGSDPHCPRCVRGGGIAAIVQHLEKCIQQNEADAATGSDNLAATVADEQRRMVAILKLYRMQKEKK